MDLINFKARIHINFTRHVRSNLHDFFLEIDLGQTGQRINLNIKNVMFGVKHERKYLKNVEKLQYQVNTVNTL